MICCKKSRFVKDWMLQMSENWRKKTLNERLRRNSKRKRRQNDEKSIITWWKFEEWRKMSSAKEIIARKNEKARIKQIKKMKKQSVFIFTKLMIFIANLEAKWKSSNEMWNAKQKKKRSKDEMMMIMTMFNLSWTRWMIQIWDCRWINRWRNRRII